MRSGNSFFSLRISSRRVASVTIWAALAFLAILALLAFLDVQTNIRWATPIIAAIALCGWFRWQKRPWTAPDLSPDQSIFRVSLPGALPLALDSLIVVLFCLGGCVFGAVVALRFGDILHKGSSGGLDLGTAGILALGVVYLLLCAGGGIYFLLRISRLAVFSLAAPGDGTLTARFPLRTARLPLTGLRVRRILAPGDGPDLYALEITPKTGPAVWIPAFPENPHLRRFLDELCAWLEARGVPLSTQRRLIPSSPFFLLWEIVSFAAIAIVCVLGTPAIVAPASFWFQWLLWGTADAFLVISCYMAGVFLGMIIGFVVMGKWVRNILTGALFSKPPKPEDCFPILTMEESCSAETFAAPVRRNGLRAEGNVLVVEAGKDIWRIEASRILEIRRADFDVAANMMSSEHIFPRPFKILWKEEDGCVRGLYMASRAGWISFRDRKLDRQLLGILETWRSEGGIPGLAQLSLGPRRLGPALAAIFLILAAVAMPIHDLLVRDCLLTGKLRTPPWVKPGNLQPDMSVLSVQAFKPGPILSMETFGRSSYAPRYWTKDLVSGQTRPFAPVWNPVLSIPGKATHILQTSYLFPLELPSLLSKHSNRTDRPPQIFSLDTGQGRDVLSFPDGRHWGCPTALYNDERAFYAFNVEDHNGATIEMGWIDLRKDERHPLGQIRDIELNTGCHDRFVPPPAFFPGGRHILCSWNVINTETGQLQPIARPAALQSKNLSFQRMDIFFNGDRLRLRVRPPEAPTTYSLRSRAPSAPASSTGQTSQTTMLICEIDPVTAKAEIIDTLPKKVTLLSADGNRWLVSEQTADTNRPVLKLYDHDTRTSRSLFTQHKDALYRLVAGQPNLLVWSLEEGFSIETIEGK